MMIEYELMDLFQKILVLNNQSHTRYIQSDNPTSLTDTQAIVLDFILVRSRTMNVFSRDIERYFGVRASSVNSVINYLERAGFIERQSCDEDKRFKHLMPTEKAHAVEMWLFEVIHDSIIDTFAGFTKEEMNNLKSMMTKMRLNLTNMAARREPHYPRDPEKAYSTEEYPNIL